MPAELTLDDVQKVLLDMGDTTEAVVATLISSGVKGSKCNAFGCPISNYLKAKFPGYRFGVAGPYVAVKMDGKLNLLVPCPTAVWTVVNEIDRDKYPELIADV